MGTIAEKLTYLNDTKQLLKENINNLGGNLTTEPFRQYASVLEGIYERIPKVSGIGASLSLSPSLMGKIKLNEIQGNTLQDGTPTPSSPVPIQSVTGLQNIGITGKNLFDTSNFIDTTNIGVTTTFNKSKITLNGTLTGAGNVFVWNNSIFTKLQAGTYTFHFEQLNGSYSNPDNKDIAFTLYVNNQNIGNVNLRGTRPSITFTLETSQYIKFGIYANGILTLNNWTIGFQLEKGSNATEYEEYKGNTYEVNLGNIELNKIGTYQDRIYKDNGKWYVEKNIGKVVLDGTESDSTYNTGTTGSFTRFGYLPFVNTDVCKIQSDYVSNYFKYLGTIGEDTTEAGISNTNVSGLNRLFIFLPTSTASTIAQFKAWLSTHNTEIKYIKATPTYTVITNTELIEDLESLNNAKSEDGTTNITITSQDLAMILNVGVLKGE